MASGSSSDAIGAVAHFSSAEKNNYQPIILYPVKISFRNVAKIKIFSDEKMTEKIYH